MRHLCPRPGCGAWLPLQNTERCNVIGLIAAWPSVRGFLFLEEWAALSDPKGKYSLTFVVGPIVSARKKSLISKDFTMKTFGSFSRVVGLCASTALLSSVALGAPQTGSAQVRSVKNSVWIGNESAKVGDVAKPGSTVKTGSGSSTSLYLGVNGPDVNVRENSMLAIDELSFDDAGVETVITTKLGLSQGEIQGRVNKTSSQSSYLVTTPKTTAAIRGTVYTIRANGDVYVWEGCVDVVSGGSNFNVCKGQALTFSPAGVASVGEIPVGVVKPAFAVSVSGQAPAIIGPVVSPIKGK